MSFAQMEYWLNAVAQHHAAVREATERAASEGEK
jgi:hypothetical protein